jgi:hypothetical protein
MASELRMVPRDDVALLLLHLVAKLSHLGGGADVDGLACCLYWPTNYG